MHFFLTTTQNTLVNMHTLKHFFFSFLIRKQAKNNIRSKIGTQITGRHHQSHTKRPNLPKLAKRLYATLRSTTRAGHTHTHTLTQNVCLPSVLCSLNLPSVPFASLLSFFPDISFSRRFLLFLSARLSLSGRLRSWLSGGSSSSSSKGACQCFLQKEKEKPFSEML